MAVKENLTVRLPPDLRADCERLADEAGTTLATYIVVMLNAATAAADVGPEARRRHLIDLLGTVREDVEQLPELADIGTNHRGVSLSGETLDGSFDGWPWQAWHGTVIAYGATEDDAVGRLREKLQEETP